jgi:hypothetical protein
LLSLLQQLPGSRLLPGLTVLQQASLVAVNLGCLPHTDTSPPPAHTFNPLINRWVTRTLPPSPDTNTHPYTHHPSETRGGLVVPAGPERHFQAEPWIHRAVRGGHHDVVGLTLHAQQQNNRVRWKRRRCSRMRTRSRV